MLCLFGFVLLRLTANETFQTVNYAHLLPTRYALELESLKGSVSSETFKETTQREDAKKAIKKHFEERYARGANRWCKSLLVLALEDVDS